VSEEVGLLPPLRVTREIKYQARIWKEEEEEDGDYDDDDDVDVDDRARVFAAKQVEGKGG